MAEIGRLLTAMVTPFDEEGEIDYTKARKLARALLDSGSDGLVIGGTTGESPSMSDDEKIRLFAEVKEEIGDEGAVIAGTTDNNHRKSVELSIEAEKIGADGLLLTVPAYNKPTQEGLYQHFKAIAEATSLPGILYNVPSRTSLNMTDDTTLRLAEIDNIVGVKEASSDPVQITRIIDGAPDGVPSLVRQRRRDVLYNVHRRLRHCQRRGSHRRTSDQGDDGHDSRGGHRASRR